jgi:hypothetical protein
VFDRSGTSRVGTGTAKVTNWDSVQLVLRLMAVVAGVSALVVMLPQVLARAFVSVLLLAHFLGIASATMSIEPSPWVMYQLWAHVFRPYLLFMYLNNAYHFYAPEPGPATLIWMRIEYEKKGGQRYWRWVHLPDLEDGVPLRADGTQIKPYLEYTRRLSMAENLNETTLPPRNYPQLQEARRLAVETKHIPWHPEEVWSAQYRPPGERALRWIETYVQYAAAHFKHQARPELAVTRVKVYRVVHRIMEPVQYKQGLPPDDPSLFYPFYQGEYDKDGRPTPDSAKDPLYGWLIPIIRRWKPGREPSPGEVRRFNPDDTVLLDYLAIQAGDESPNGAEP